MSLNKVITSVNALANSVSIPDVQLNNVVCIDTVNNRIGVQTANPTREIDISGMLKTNFIYLNNRNNSASEFDISYDTSFVTFSRGIKIEESISCENIFCNFIDLSSITGDVSFTNNIDISGSVNISEKLNVDLSLVVTGNIEGQQVKANGVILTSDDRYKHNERNINNGLEIIRQLQPQVYDKTSTFKDENYRGLVNEPYFVEAGLIAQEVFAINDISYAVKEGSITRPYYLNYNNIFVYGVAGIKELDNIVSNLSNRLNNLSNRLNNLSNGTPDVSDINLSNIRNLIVNQNTLIQSLNTKIVSLETRINNLENK
tara:strand:+ start:1480 stop:2427 length:948 start_codon:yes stop_codon:yes gene_type:complete